MGWWEMLVARMVAWLVQRHLMRPRPLLVILSLKERGGSSDYVGFSAEIVNYGTQAARVQLSATVDGQSVECRPAKLDLSPNASPEKVQIVVPRPQLGTLVHAMNDACTLYGATLCLEARAGKNRAKPMIWKEAIPDPETDRARYDALQQAWHERPGHGQKSD